MSSPLRTRARAELTRRATRPYYAGPALGDALAACLRLRQLDLAGAVCHWNREDEDPDRLGAAHLDAIAALGRERLDCYLAIKAPALDGRADLVDPIARRAAAHRVALLFDAQEPQHVDDTLALAARASRLGTETGLALPARWERSGADAERAVALGLSVRVVKGQWPEWPLPAEHPEPDQRSAFLELVGRVAGRVPVLRIATHEASLADEALALAQRAGAALELEYLYGLPLRPALDVARVAQVPARLYVPYGHGWLPYDVSDARQDRRAARWLAADVLAVRRAGQLPRRDVRRLATGRRVAASEPTGWRAAQLTNIDAAGEQWRELARRSGNVFSTWEWAAAWWRHLAGERPLLAQAWYDPGGRLQTILPLYGDRRGRWRVVRFIGEPVGDQLAPVCDPADRATVADLLAVSLAGSSWPWDMFASERLPREHGWGALLGARVLGHESNPVLRRDGRSWEEFVGTRSARFRKRMRRVERALERARASFRLCDDPERLTTDLHSLFSLHAERWDRRSQAFAGPRRAFHEEFARAALAQGWLRLWLLEADGRPLAAWYGFRYGGSDWFYQSGRDPRRADDSLGTALLLHTIRASFDDGQEEYRFLRGDEPYKARFSNQDHGLEHVVLGHGAVGRTVSAGLLARERARALRQRPSRATV